MRHSADNSKTSGHSSAKRDDRPFSVLGLALDLIFPPTCLVCATAIKKSQRFKELCLKCTPDIHKALELCAVCGSSDSSLIKSAATCYQCLNNPFSARYIRSLSAYNNKSRQVIKAFKYRNNFALAKPLAKLLAENMETFPQQDWNLLLAMPSHRKAIHRRGFSHMHLVAKEFSKSQGLSFKPYALQHRGKAHYQSLTEIKDRYKQMRRAFFADKDVVRKQRILLLDDVITTGASLENASLALIKAGALSVDILSFARSSKFSKNRHFKP